MQVESDILTMLPQLQGLDSYLECMLMMFQHPDSIIEVLVPAQEEQLIVSWSHKLVKTGERKKKKST